MFGRIFFFSGMSVVFVGAHHTCSPPLSLSLTHTRVTTMYFSASIVEIFSPIYCCCVFAFPSFPDTHLLLFAVGQTWNITFVTGSMKNGSQCTRAPTHAQQLGNSSPLYTLLVVPFSKQPSDGHESFEGCGRQQHEAG